MNAPHTIARNLLPGVRADSAMHAVPIDVRRAFDLLSRHIAHTGALTLTHTSQRTIWTCRSSSTNPAAADQPLLVADALRRRQGLQMW